MEEEADGLEFVKPSLQKQRSLEDRKKFQAHPSLLNSSEFEPQVTCVVPGTSFEPMKRDKYNSTSTIFMSTAMPAPDVDEIVLCMSRALFWNIKEHQKKEVRLVDVFSEVTHPLGDGKVDFDRLPDIEEIEEFLFTVFGAQDLSAECGVMATAYIERLIKLTGITLHPSNWRRIVLGALLLSSKVWEDLAVWNVDFLSVFPNVDLRDLNQLEREYLTSLRFTVTLTASVYAKYYFALRSLSDRTEDYFPLKPLDHKAAEFLEAKSRGLEESEKIKSVHSQRSYSLNPYQTSSNVALEQLRLKFGKNWKDD